MQKPGSKKGRIEEQAARAGAAVHVPGFFRVRILGFSTESGKALGDRSELLRG